MGSVYSMQKRADGWVISVGSDEILTCTRRTTAIRVIQQAADRLGLRENAFKSSMDSYPEDVTLTAARPGL